MVQLETLKKPPSAREIMESAVTGVKLETIPFENIVISEELAHELRDELDDRRVEYLATSIQAGRTPVLRVLLKARIVTGEEERLKFQYELLHKAGLVKTLELLGYSECEAVVLYGFDNFNLKDALPEELLQLSERGTKIERIEKIPVSSLVLEGKITDEEHEAKLEDQMGVDGQKVPMWLRARSTESGIVYDIIDGYHRGSVLNKLRITLGLAQVSYGMSNEELYDQRVIAANSVRSVQFARVIRWMQRSYLESTWARDYNLKLSTILGLAFQKDKIGHPGKRLGLTPKKAQEAIAWVEGKAQLWQGELGTIYLQIRAAEISFEEITEQVRVSSGGGHKGSGVFNPGKFVAMAEELPGELHLQRKMLAIIREHNPNADDTRLVARALKLKRRVPHTVKALERDPVNVAREILGEEEVWDDQIPVGAKGKTPDGAHAAKGTGRSSRRIIRQDMLTAAEETGAQVNPSILSDLRKSDRGTILVSQQSVGELSVGGHGLGWLEQVPNISEQEKIAVTMLFLEGRLPEAVCQVLGITPNKLDQLVSSAQLKYALYLDDLRYAQQFVKPD
ncbi:hypothetical protein KKB64_01800 [Patescibacteria group bacterium]|nr:hypothetical protein [Patescibacteria group bacterium]MBU1472505.1 hypothetical protein [Patescibacteria group bacterium]MBU2460122.1 hypothetical protein [Patescibacteria group bacterium]MBU2544691.1 hypothetical protein [Patescibacteria group bacterium]